MGVVAVESGVEGVGRCVVAHQQRWHQDTFLPQVSHEKLQANQSEDTEAEHSQDHDISQLLHRLDKSSNNRLQTYGEGRV